VFLLATSLLTLLSQPAVLALVNWSLETFTDLRMEARNPQILLGQGVISADEVHLLPREQGGPALFSVLDLQVSTSLWDLLSRDLGNTLISASQVLIYVSENDQARDPRPGSWIELTTWTPSQLYVGQVHLITAAENTWVFPLRELQGRRLDGRTFRARALADYDGEPLEANLDLLGTRRDGRVQSLDVRAVFFAPESNSRIVLEGSVEGRDEKFRYDFNATANYRDIGRFVEGLAAETPLQGELHLEASMVGNSRQFTLSDASLVVDNMPEYGFEAAGELDWERSGNTQIRLIAAGEMANLEYLLNWIDLDVTALGRARASIELSGSLDNPAVDRFVLVTESEQGLSVNVSGALPSLDLDPNEPVSSASGNNEIRVDAHAPSMSVLAPWLGEVGFDPGPWRASWVTRGNRQQLRLDDIVLETGLEQTVLTRVEGEVGKIINATEIDQGSFSDIELQLTMATPDTAHLSELLDLNLPAYHALEAQLQVNGSGEILQLSEGTLAINSSDLQASVTGFSGRFRPGSTTAAFENLSAGIEASLSDTAALSQYTDFEVPFLGPATLSGRLSQTNSRFGLRDISLAINGAELALAGSGRIDDLARFSGVQLEMRIERLDTSQLLGYALDGFDYGGDLGYLTGGFDLINPDSAWRISDLMLASAETSAESALGVTVAGDIYDVTGFATADLDGRLHVRDTALMEAVTGLRIRPLSARVTAAAQPGQLNLNVNGVAGDTEVDALIKVAHTDAGVSRLEARVSTPHLYLRDLGLQVDPQGDGAYAPGEDINAGARTGLEALLEKSPAFPTDIEIVVEGITGRNTNIDSLDVHATGEDGRYTLRRFSLGYDDAAAEVRGVIDLTSSPPFASLAGEALAIPLSTLSQDLGAPSDIRGTLTARGGVAASGTDIPALIASLNGSLAIALEDTTIQGAAYDVLATDLLAWIYSGAALQDSTHLDCTMARFDIRDGVARTDSIYVESARMIATGKGKFDLPRQKLDLTITPRSRSRSFQIPSEVRLRGDMSSPRATISPVSAAADASAQALLLIPKLALRLFGAGGAPSNKGVQPCQAVLD
jgi:uncharacterized protein involved in outer membrane biogenesis